MEKIDPSWNEMEWGQSARYLPSVTREIFNSLFPEYPSSKNPTFGMMKQIAIEQRRALQALGVRIISEHIDFIKESDNKIIYSSGGQEYILAETSDIHFFNAARIPVSPNIGIATRNFGDIYSLPILDSSGRTFAIVGSGLSIDWALRDHPSAKIIHLVPPGNRERPDLSKKLHAAFRTEDMVIHKHGDQTMTISAINLHDGTKMDIRLSQDQIYLATGFKVDEELIQVEASKLTIIDPSPKPGSIEKLFPFWEPVAPSRKPTDTRGTKLPVGNFNHCYYEILKAALSHMNKCELYPLDNPYSLMFMDGWRCLMEQRAQLAGIKIHSEFYDILFTRIKHCFTDTNLQEKQLWYAVRNAFKQGVLDVSGKRLPVAMFVNGNALEWGHFFHLMRSKSILDESLVSFLTKAKVEINLLEKFDRFDKIAKQFDPMNPEHVMIAQDYLGYIPIVNQHCSEENQIDHVYTETSKSGELRFELVQGQIHYTQQLVDKAPSVVQSPTTETSTTKLCISTQLDKLPNQKPYFTCQIQRQVFTTSQPQGFPKETFTYRSLLPTPSEPFQVRNYAAVNVPKSELLKKQAVYSEQLRQEVMSAAKKLTENRLLFESTQRKLLTKIEEGVRHFQDLKARPHEVTPHFDKVHCGGKIYGETIHQYPELNLGITPASHFSETMQQAGLWATRNPLSQLIIPILGTAAGSHLGEWVAQACNTSPIQQEITSGIGGVLGMGGASLLVGLPPAAAIVWMGLVGTSHAAAMLAKYESRLLVPSLPEAKRFYHHTKATIGAGEFLNGLLGLPVRVIQEVGLWASAVGEERPSFSPMTHELEGIVRGAHRFLQAIGSVTLDVAGKPILDQTPIHSHQPMNDLGAPKPPLGPQRPQPPSPIPHFTAHLWANRVFDSRFSTPVDHLRQQAQWRFEAAKSSTSFLRPNNLYQAIAERAESPFNPSWFGHSRRGFIQDWNLKNRAKDAYERAKYNRGTFGDAYTLMARDLGWPAGFDFREFVNILRSAGLVSSYNAIHVRAYSNIPRTGSLIREIGGVATRVGEIIGLKALLDSGKIRHFNFAVRLPDGEQPFTQEELLQVLTELRAGIFVHDAYPFFSLHFNHEHQLTPVIHPFYENTLVGYTTFILDGWLKGFLNGSFYEEVFLKSWSNHHNEDELRTNVKDLKKYARLHGIRYSSLRELNFKVELEFPELSPLHDTSNPNSIYRMKFMTSFRIIAKQNRFQFDEQTQTFFIEPDFDVEYSIDLMPDYEAYLKNYAATHGHYPEDYQAVLEIYRDMKNRIKEDMPRLPFCKPYFNKLAVISFCSYLFHTLRQAHQVPDLPALTTQRLIKVPSAFPHIPVRHYQFQAINITLKDIFIALSREEKTAFNQLLHAAMNPSTEQHLSSSCDPIIERLFLEKIQTHIPVEAIEEDPEIHAAVKARFLAFYHNRMTGIARKLHSELKEDILSLSSNWELELSVEAINNLSLLDAIKVMETAVQKKYREDSRQITMLIQRRINELETELNQVLEGLEHNKHSEINKIPAHLRGINQQNINNFIALIEAKKAEATAHYQTKMENIRSHGSNAVTEHFTTAKNERLHVLSEMKQSIRAPLTTLELNESVTQIGKTFQYPYSTLSFDPPNGQSHTQVVGGCGVALSGKKLERMNGDANIVANAAPIAGVVMKQNNRGQDYATFSMQIKTQHALSPLDYAPFLAFQRNRLSAPLSEKELECLETGILTKAANVDATDPAGQTLAHHAARENELPLFQAIGRLEVHDQHGLTPFHVAAQNGSTEIVAYYLAHFPEHLESTTTCGLTALSLAIEHGQLAVTEQLISFGANINHIPPNGMFPLYVAIQEGHEDLALLLIQSGRVNLDLTLEGNGMSALHLAISMKSEKVASCLIRNGADVSLKQKLDGSTALHVAASLGLTDLCIELLEKGMAVDLPIESGKTPLMLAASNGHVGTVKCLVEAHKAQVDLIAQGETALLLALRRSEYETAKYLAIQVKVSLPTTFEAMLFAAKQNLFDIAELLIQRGVSPLLQDAEGNSYLYYVLQHGQLSRYEVLSLQLNLTHHELFHGQSSLAVALSHGHLLLAYTLESYGASYQHPHKTKLEAMIEHDDIGGFRQYFAERGYPTEEMKEAVLQAGRYGSQRCLQEALKHLKANRLTFAEPKSSIHHPFFGAVQAGNARCIQIILEHSPESIRENLQTKSVNGTLTFFKATNVASEAGNKRWLCYLEKQGADLPETTTPDNQPTELMIAAATGNLRALKLLIKQNVPLDAQDNEGNTALHYALLAGQIATSQELISHSNHRLLQLQNHEGFSPFMLAVAKDLLPLTKLFCVADEIERFNHAGLNALHIAAVKGSLNVLPFLIQSGFDPDSKDQQHQYTALHCAADAGKKEAFQLLLALGADPLQKDKWGKTAFARAAMNHEAGVLSEWVYQLVKALPNADELLRELWFSAASGNNTRVLRELLLEDFPINTLTEKGTYNALHIAVINEAEDVVHLLLSGGVDRNQQGGAENQTPLHEAVLASSFPVLKLLALATGIDLNVQNRSGKTALHLAIEKKQDDFVQFLLEAGADPSIEDNDHVSVNQLMHVSAVMRR